MSQSKLRGPSCCGGTGQEKQNKKKRTSKQTHLNGSAGFLIHFPSSDIVMLNLGLLIADKGYWAKLFQRNDGVGFHTALISKQWLGVAHFYSEFCEECLGVRDLQASCRGRCHY